MAQTAQKGLKDWHSVAEQGSSPEALHTILHPDAVFHSPVVYTPQRGRPIVMAYLSAAGQTLGNGSFRYIRELIDGNTAVLEFQTKMDGIVVNGIDIITFDEDGLITDFKVMVRPMKAMNKVWEMMATQLKSDQKSAIAGSAAT
ncbi:MAG: nuclear transport factor 2 family protein [Pseudomonadota bacterium]